MTFLAHHAAVTIALVPLIDQLDHPDDRDLLGDRDRLVARVIAATAVQNERIDTNSTFIVL
jgi:hypothetical protein